MNTENLKKAYYLSIIKCLSYVIGMVGVVVLLPVIMVIFYPEEQSQMQCFVLPGIAYILLGYLIYLFLNQYSVSEFQKNGGHLFVLLIWVISIVLGAIPFYLTGGYSFVGALFESTSGFTTTGFTITDVENTTHMILIYRSLLHLIGGVGMVLVLSLILSRTFNMQLFKAEGHTDSIGASVALSARMIIIIYLGLIIGGTVLYTVFGMPIFDAVNHSISAVSTGGFSTKASSIGYWHSVPIDITTIVLMFLGATNFLTSLTFLRGKWRSVINNSETRLFVFLIALVTPIVTVELLVNGICEHVLSAIDNAVFQVVAIITTTGLSTVDNFLPRCGNALIPIIFLMMVGGNSGSTAGGIKAYRAALAVRTLFYNYRSETESKRIHRGKYIYRYGKMETIKDSEQISNYSYITLYILIGLLGTFALMCCGYPFLDSFVEFFSALGTVGMSIGIVSPAMSEGAMWIIMIGMLMARLEINVFIISLFRISAIVRDVFKRGAFNDN